MSTTTQTTIRGAALGGWPRSWRAAAGLTSVAAGAVILLGAFLPWVEAFAGLVQVPGVRGSNGQILAAAGAAIACAGLYQLARPAERARWFTGLAGFAAVGFSGYLLIQLARSMRVLGGDSMVIARPGPGLWVVATGSLAAFSTLFFPPSSQATLRRDARRPAMAWVADRESAGLRRGLQVALGVLGQLERLGHVGSVRDGFELVPPGVDGGAAGPADREGELAARLARGHRAGRPVDRSPAVPPHVPAEPRPGLRPAGAVQPLCLERLRAELPDPGDIADQIPDQFGRGRDMHGHGSFHLMSISADRRAVTFPERSGRTVPVMSRHAGGGGVVQPGAAATAAAGPGLALRRLQPRGPALRLAAAAAAAAAGVAAAVMAVAAAAIVVAVTGLCLWARHFAGYHHGTIPGVYLALVVAATTVTLVSAARGTRAPLAET